MKYSHPHPAVWRTRKIGTEIEARSNAAGNCLCECGHPAGDHYLDDNSTLAKCEDAQCTCKRFSIRKETQ